MNNKSNEKEKVKKEKPIYAKGYVDLNARVFIVVIIIALILYGTIGLLNNDIYLPGRRTEGIHFSGTSAWVMYGAILAIVFYLSSAIVCHYDRRDNHNKYKKFQIVAGILSFIMVVLAIILTFNQ